LTEIDHEILLTTCQQAANLTLRQTLFPGGNRMRRPVRRGLAALAVLTLLAGACSRDDGDTETDAGATTTAAPGDGGDATTTTAAEEANRLDSAAFGDLEDVCTDGDSSGATDTGVTDDSIQVGTFTDKGFTSRPGLNQEMYDAAVAFAAWCNEHGGIGGRELVIADRDAAIGAFNDRIVESCDQDFAMVGGGAVLDDADNGGRVACGLPNIPGYVVSATAREADLQVQPVPNPLDKLMAGQYRVLAEADPEAIAHYGIMTSTFGSVLLVRDTSIEAATQFGYEVVYNREYSAGGESNWRPFVEEMQSAGVQILEFVGEPENLAQLQEAMQLVGYFPEITIQPPNFYDANYVDLVADFAQGVEVRTQYTPFELADTNPATADFLELMERYNPSGKVASLGAQTVSAFLLFAQSAAACGSELTRECLLEEAGSVTEWTGGGLHTPQDPSTNTPSDCFALLALTPEGFVVDEERTQANEGIFNCDPANVVDVSGGG
jgi:hypothetical protein